MKVPKQVIVKGKTYSVQLKENINHDGHDCDGLMDPSAYTISIVKSLRARDLKQTFLHEWLHAILHESGISVTSVEPDNIEIIVENISNELMDKMHLKWK